MGPPPIGISDRAKTNSIHKTPSSAQKHSSSTPKAILKRQLAVLKEADENVIPKSHDLPSPFIDEKEVTEPAPMELSGNSRSPFVEKVISIIGNKPVELEESTKQAILAKAKAGEPTKFLAECLQSLVGRLKCPECFTCLGKPQGKQGDYLKCNDHGRKHGAKLLSQFPTEILSALIESSDKSKLIETLATCFPDRAPALKDLLPGGRQTGINKFFPLSDSQEEEPAVVSDPAIVAETEKTMPEAAHSVAREISEPETSNGELPQHLPESQGESFAEKCSREVKAALSSDGLAGLIDKMVSIFVAQNNKILSLESELAAQKHGNASYRPQVAAKPAESFLDAALKGREQASKMVRKPATAKLSQREINKVIDAPARDIVALTTYHIKGFKKGPMKTIKSIFKEAGISHGAMYDLVWVGRNIAEIISPEHHKDEVVSKLTALSKTKRFAHLRIELINFDAHDASNIRSETETRSPKAILTARLEKKVARLTETVKKYPFLTKTLNYVKKQLELKSLVVPIYRPPADHDIVTLGDFVEKAQEKSAAMEISPALDQAKTEMEAPVSAPAERAPCCAETDSSQETGPVAMEVSTATEESEKVDEHACLNAEASMEACLPESDTTISTRSSRPE